MTLAKSIHTCKSVVDQSTVMAQDGDMPDGYRVSLRDVARAAGISVSAVSLALKNSPKISEKRRDEILRMAKQMGYQRDPRITELMEHLRTARPKRSNSNICIIIPELNHAQLVQYSPIRKMIGGIGEIANIAGFGIDYLYLSDSGMSLRRARSILTARGIRGVFIAPFASGVARIDFDCQDLCVATAGYSIVEPRLDRACPNYLQMMDELLSECSKRGYKRVGLIMTYNEGGIGHKLFASSFLYYQSSLPPKDRLEMLPKPMISAANVRKWFDAQKPDVIISAGSTYEILLSIGLRIPEDVAFASIDISQPPNDAAGMDHRYDLVGREVMKILMTLVNLNITGSIEYPKTVLVDSHYKSGFTLPDKTGKNRITPERSKEIVTSAKSLPDFRGFLY
jgi:LacI family transcriptional regulator